MEARNLKSVAEKHDITYHRLRNWTREGLIKVEEDNTIPKQEDEKIIFIKKAFDAAAEKGSRLKTDEVRQMLEDEFRNKVNSEEDNERKQEVILSNAVETSFKRMGIDEVMLEFAERAGQLLTKEEFKSFLNEIGTNAKAMIHDEVAVALKEELPGIIAEQLKLLENPEAKKQMEKTEQLEKQNEQLLDEMKNLKAMVQRLAEEKETPKKKKFFGLF